MIFNLIRTLTMRRNSNDCGVRNSFGYYDARTQEILLKRPCFKKNDITDVYNWLNEATELRKFSIGYTAIDNISVNDCNDHLYAATRNAIKNDVLQTEKLDNDFLKNALSRIKNKPLLQNIAFKCFVFYDDPLAFDLLIQAIKSIKHLVYLDLAGCFFSTEQLVQLSQVISECKIAHLFWPELNMSAELTEIVAQNLRDNKSLVVIYGAPAEFQKIAHDNRHWLFSVARHPAKINDKEMAIIKEYADSLRLGIAYEKQRLFDLEKTVEAALA